MWGPAGSLSIQSAPLEGGSRFPGRGQVLVTQPGVPGKPELPAAQPEATVFHASQGQQKGVENNAPLKGSPRHLLASKWQELGWEGGSAGTSCLRGV